MTAKNNIAPLEKCPTGIRGLDEITQGGYRAGGPHWFAAARGAARRS